MNNIKQTIKNFPDSPGIYLMYNNNNKIIYVGKAKNLKSRVSSYFNKNNVSLKTKFLVNNIYDIKYIVTKTEVEAFILEDSYIKQYKPKYNIRLKDDKRYPYIAINLDEDFPRLQIHRRATGKNTKYFGPFPSNSTAHKIINILNQVFKLRKCKILKFGKRACLYYHIKQCDGPCINKIDKTEYQKKIADIINILNGNTDELIKQVELKMKKSAENKDFETAADLRDKMFALKELFTKQSVDSANLENYDVIGFAIQKKIINNDYTGCIQKFVYRFGKMVHNEIYYFDADNDTVENTDYISDIFSRFIIKSYKNSMFIPNEIIFQSELTNIDLLEKWLTENRGTKVKIVIPQKGKKLELIKFVKSNCEHIVKQQELKIKINMNKLIDTQKIFKLEKPPEYIYGFDISNISGKFAVGSAVCFRNGLPFKQAYRKYKIKTVRGIDEYAMMRELLFRHFKNMIENKNKIFVPDLVMIDGGIQHLNVGIEVIRNKLKITGKFKIISIAKKEEIIFTEDSDKPLLLKKDTSVSRMIQFIRDEAHRFGITYHKNLRDKSVRISVLDSIKGIGETKKSELIKHFKSVENIKFASFKELMKVKGINKNLAEVIFKNFNT